MRLLICMHSFNKLIYPSTWKFRVSATVALAKTGIKRLLPFSCSYLCQSTRIQSWTHTFLVSGHSFLPSWFLPNDADFGKIKRAKSINVSIFPADDQKSVIRQCNFNMLDMKEKFVDFDFSNFQNSLTFHKMNTSAEKFLIFQLKWMKVTKGKECVLEYRKTSNPNAEIKQIDFSKWCVFPLWSHS